jgi:hypothetical protein
MISIISLTPELQAYAVQKMYLALTKDSTQVRNIGEQLVAAN